MPFLAAHSVSCVKCQETIIQGEPISWTRGKGATPGIYHVACPGHMPPAVSFALPNAATSPTMTDLMVSPETIPDYDDDLPEIEPDPLPGTRRWFETATMDDREYQIALGAQDCTTQREFTKLVMRYSKRATDRECARLRRYARGVWAGLTVKAPEYADTDQLTLELFPRPETGETDHSRMTQTWRDLLPALQAMPA